MSGTGYRLTADLSSTADIKLVNRHLSFPKARLVEPKTSGFVQIAAEVDGIWPFGLGPKRRNKQEALASAVEVTQKLEEDDSVLSAKVFEASFIPPGQGDRLEDRPEVHQARFDLSIVIETVDMESAIGLEANETYRAMLAMLHQRSTANTLEAVVAPPGRFVEVSSAQARAGGA